MEKESFEDEQVANSLNDNFVAIKVDREERPDVDNIYMNVCNIMTGSGGWPLSVLMDSAQKPFFAGTYFPRKSFLAILSQAAAMWKNQRADIESQANKLTLAVTKNTFQHGDIDSGVPSKAFNDISSIHDKTYGGFGNAPKFPSPHILMFLLKYNAMNDESPSIVTHTLDAYRNGGLFDQIGYGFFRYSTDRQLRIPHFEKMLYDNALLCQVYAEAFALTGEERFAQTAREVIAYLCRDMRSADGGFYTAEDADSEGVEGKFYLFGKDELASVLEEDAEIFFQIFPVSEAGNFEGRNHLYLADRRRMGAEEKLINICRDKLLRFRNSRPRPLRDEKFLASQNGMALAALAVAGRALGDSAIIALARETEAFIHGAFVDSAGNMTSCVIGGKTGQPGFAEDYSFYIYGLLELYFATGEDIYRRRAIAMNAKLLEDFSCPEGGFYQTGRQAERLISRSRDIYDGATPSANAVAAHNLVRLSRLGHNETLMDAAAKSIKSFMGTIAGSPVSHCFSAINLLLLSGAGADVTLVGKSLGEINELRKVIPYHFCDTIRTIVGEDSGYPTLDGKPTAYVCANRQCYPPTTDPEIIRATLTK